MDKKKAVWNSEIINIFCDLCIKEIEAGRRLGTHFTKTGWENLIANFNKETGREYTKLQLKNRWDTLKNDWKLWKQLVGKETGLGWNYKLNTIDAPEDWWRIKIQEFPNAAKFRKEGIDKIMEDKLDRMFTNIVATGENSWAPSSGQLPSESTEASKTDTVANEEDTDDYVPKEADKEKNTTSTEERKGKRVAIKEKKTGVAMKLVRQFDRLIEAMDKRTEVLKSKEDTNGANITEALRVVASLPGIEAGSDLWLFATTLFMNKVKIDIFNSIDDPVVKVKWLRYEKEQHVLNF